MSRKFSDCLDERGFVIVNNHLQVKGYRNIFAVGDIIPLDQEKLGQNAEFHADVVFHNLASFDKRQKMKSYEPASRFMLISLGNKKCMMIDGKKVLTEGVTTRMIKTLVEKKVMLDFR